MNDDALIMKITSFVEVFEWDSMSCQNKFMTEETIKNQTLLLANLIVLLRDNAVIIDTDIDSMLHELIY